MKNFRLLRMTAAAALASAMLAACNGGTGSGTAPIPMAPGSTVPSASAMSAMSDSSLLAQALAAPAHSLVQPDMAPPTTVYTSPGAVNGGTGMPNGDTSNGGQGLNVDQIRCDKSMYSNDYHVHAFVGIIVRGKWAALPGAIGMVQPGTPTNGFWDSATNCFYHIHTHDRSGIVHIEDPTHTALTAARNTLGQFLDIWGVRFGPKRFGSHHGKVTVYSSGQVYRGGGSNTTISSSLYQQVTTPPRDIQLYSHEVIWIVVGTPPAAASSLPSVHFYMEY